MSEDYEFSLYEPLYHEDLDSWGLAQGTRIWKADGSFEAVGEIEAGDFVFGITFRKEEVGLGGDRRGLDGIARAWRPRLTSREVLGVRTVEARSWQLTFGDAYEQYESRRLVAGAETELCTFPVSHKNQGRFPLHRCPTALENPRVDTEYRKSQAVAEQLKQDRGARIEGAYEFDEMPRGKLAVTVPFQSYGGQTGMFDTRIRTYDRYTFNEVREITPLEADARLVQLVVQSDTKEKDGIFGDDAPRANVIAQTPFAPETERVDIVEDQAEKTKAGRRSFNDQESFNQAWESFVSDAEAQNREISEGDTTTQERQRQGIFYKSLEDEGLTEKLEKMGTGGGFLDGGILLSTPPPEAYN